MPFETRKRIVGSRGGWLPIWGVGTRTCSRGRRVISQQEDGVQEEKSRKLGLEEGEQGVNSWAKKGTVRIHSLKNARRDKEESHNLYNSHAKSKKREKAIK